MYYLEFDDGGLRRLTVRDREGAGPTSEYTPATVSYAQKVLGRSQRQVYRYLREGTLGILAKVSGCHLLDAAQVIGLARQQRRMARIGGLPRSFKPLFPEYSLKSLDPLKDSALILARILERGTLRDIQWAMALYDPEIVKDFLSRHAARLLSAKSLRFWTWYFGVGRVAVTPARAMGRRLGGIG